MSTERGPILRKRGNASKDADPPSEPPESAPAAPPDDLGRAAARPERSPTVARRPAPRGDAPRSDAPGERRAPIEAAPRSARAFDDRRSGGAPRAPESAGPRDGRRGERPPAAPGDERPTRDARESSRPSAGRRLYDPRAERGQGPAPAPAGVVQAPRDRAGKRPVGTGLGRPIVRDEKSELKNEAQKLSKEKGIPLVHAYRVLKGQTTLNDVLKGMMRKERFEQLVTREGVDRELAGQVASGHLPKQRAVLLTRMRTLRKQKLHIDGIKSAELEKKRIGLSVFGRGWVTGRVRAARPYDFDFLVDGSDKADKFFKHDVKALCMAEDIDAVRRACSSDEAVRTEGLAATEDRSQRVRPLDDVMLRFIDDQRVVRFTMRDGEQILGRLRSFGRWDAELVLDDGETVTIFFHGLHASSLTLGHSS